MTTVDQYINQFQPQIQERLRLIRQIFFDTTPAVVESMRYNMPSYKVGNQHLYFAAYKNHIGFYPVYGVDEIEEKISRFRAKGTKDTLHFPYHLALPSDLIQEIIILKSKIREL